MRTVGDVFAIAGARRLQGGPVFSESSVVRRDRSFDPFIACREKVDGAGRRASRRRPQIRRTFNPTGYQGPANLERPAACTGPPRGQNPRRVRNPPPLAVLKFGTQRDRDPRHAGGTGFVGNQGGRGGAPPFARENSLAKPSRSHPFLSGAYSVGPAFCQGRLAAQSASSGGWLLGVAFPRHLTGAICAGLSREY